MSVITIHPETQSVFVQIKNHHAFIERSIKYGFEYGGKSAVDEMARLIKTGPKTGRMYGNHRASAPGESPANRTGRLAKSGEYTLIGAHKMEVGETAKYAGYLEFGTKKMRPRPHVLRAINGIASKMVVEFYRLGI